MGRTAIDFDRITTWGDSYAQALRDVVPDEIGTMLREGQPEFVDDAADTLFEVAGRDAVIDRTLGWLKANRVTLYHGTRLMMADVASIRARGLLPLVPENRVHRLTRALSPHPDWDRVGLLLAGCIAEADSKFGRRAGQVHTSLSRTGLVDGFDHYITYGSEFDQRIAGDLLGQAGMDLLATDGVPHVIRLTVPGARALDAAHPFFSVEDVRQMGDCPNMVDKFVGAWSFGLAWPQRTPDTLRIDCCPMFRTALPPEWITVIEPLD